MKANETDILDIEKENEDSNDALVCRWNWKHKISICEFNCL